jgi:hypothetical protein
MNRRAALLALAGIAVQVAGCGGGGVAGLDSGGTGSFTSGTVTGLGSIIVGGVRYEDRGAVVVRSDGGTDSGVRVGMVVSVQGSDVAAPATPGDLPTATAERITYASEWAGSVDAVDPLADTFTVLGQTVHVRANTVFDGAATRLGELTVSMFVEVYGYLDTATGRLDATRVDAGTAAPSSYQLSGTVAALDRPARTFRLGTALIDASGLALPSGFADGRLVRVRLATRRAGEAWTAIRIDLRDVDTQALADADGAEVEVEGKVTAFASARSFSVNGLPVDAGAARIEGSLTLGAPVEVHGRAVGGVIVATRVHVENESEVEQREYEFYGTVRDLDTGARRFTLRGEQFVYTAATVFEDGVTLANGAYVKVQAAREAGRWVVTKVESGR